MKQRLFIAVLIAAPLLWLFGRALVTDEMFVFRDAAHYYYPYYKYVAQQWGEGRVPLWNPLENLGQPLLADATAAVLYPGKLIFALPLSYNTNYKLYIVGHVLFAAIGAYVAARGFARSRYASTVCAISYAFSGSVVFQYCNVIFLVGAAWLPLAILAIDRMLRLRSWKWSLALAAVLAMMVFGGDPQLAYHVALIGALYALILWRADRRQRDVATETPNRVSLSSNRFVLLFTACGFALLLAAAQILPSMEWTPKTSRAATDIPRNVYELARGVGNEVDIPTQDRYKFLLGKQENDHHIDSYVFSVGPWHLAGCLWPNVFGNLFPENTRWIRALPAEGRMWTPTLYMGLLPLLLALSQFRFRTIGRAREHTSRRTFLTWLVILSLLASFGWYSLGWIIIEIYHVIYGADAAELPIGGPFGGVYWLLQTFLPGYILFRYPAKWLVVVAMGMSLLSAYGWDGMVRGASERFLRRSLWVLLLVTFTVGVVINSLVFYYRVWERIRAAVPLDDLFGALNASAAGWQLWFAILHVFVLILAMLTLIPRGRGRFAAWRHWALLLLVVIDVCVAQGTLASSVPMFRSTWMTLAEEIYREHDHTSVPPRVYRHGHATVVGQREGQIKDQETLFPKYHLLYEIDLLESRSAMMSVDMQAWMTTARRNGMRWDDGKFPEIYMLADAGVDYTFAVANDHLYETGQLTDDGRQVWYAEEPVGVISKRARIVHRVTVAPELDEHSPDAVSQRTRQVFDNADTQHVVVETGDAALHVRSESPPTELQGDETCEIVHYAPNRVDLRTTLLDDGVVLLADAYAEGWVCEVTNRATGETTDEPILRTNRVLRGVWLPAGEYDIAFRYRPRSFTNGTILSAIGWLALIVGALYSWRFRK